VGLLAYSLVLPFRYIMLIIGTYVLCMFTTSFQLVWWFIMGVVMYLGRASVPEPPSDGTGKSKSPKAPKSILKSSSSEQRQSEKNGTSKDVRSADSDESGGDRKDSDDKKTASRDSKPKLLRAQTDTAAISSARQKKSATQRKGRSQLRKAKSEKDLSSRNGASAAGSNSAGKAKAPLQRGGSLFGLL